MTHERKYQISLIECRILLWISWYMYEIDISDPIGAWLKGWHAENHAANKGSLFVCQTVGSSPNKQKSWKYTKFVVPPQQNKGSHVIVGFDNLWLWTKPWRLLLRSCGAPPHTMRLPMPVSFFYTEKCASVQESSNMSFAKSMKQHLWIRRKSLTVHGESLPPGFRWTFGNSTCWNLSWNADWLRRIL